jgi:hypothetical protein
MRSRRSATRRKPLTEEVIAVEFRCRAGIKGGVAAARQYLPELLDDVLVGRINPGRVFDYTTDLDHVADA